MYTQVARSKRQSIVDTLAGRIRAGEYEPGMKLEGEHRLAEEFGVSRSTIRQALSELQHQRLIATETGRGSFVIFDGHQLDQDRGWTQSMASAGSDVSAEILGIESVDRDEVPLLPADVDLTSAVAVRRVRSLRTADGDEVPVSFECATVPAIGLLADLPAAGLVEDSLASTSGRRGSSPCRAPSGPTSASSTRARRGSCAAMQGRPSCAPRAPPSTPTVDSSSTSSPSSTPSTSRSR
jgi:GntR family transcriptional regulator